MFGNIPAEMRAYRQWVLWRLEHRENAKPTKVPYMPSRQLASVTNPDTWISYEDAVRWCGKPDYTTLDPKGFSGVGFVITFDDPYSFIDLDDCHDDATSYERQVKIYREFDSYSEHSPSKTGLHIIVKGKVPQGRRRSNIEIYSSERYMTMTGDVYNSRDIEDRDKLLNLLWGEMGAPPNLHTYGEDQAEKQTDDDILLIAAKAINGQKFSDLFEGKWDSYYPSQSEADYAFIDILAFYTQNKAQISRLFRSSDLGKRAKAKRADYVNYMIAKSFDRQLPPIDIDGLRIKGELLLNGTKLSGVQPTLSLAATTTDAPSTSEGAVQEGKVSFPPGLVGDVADFLLAAAPRPVSMIALAGAIGLMAGISGRAYNISGSGLNQYVLCVAETGTGKEAISSGISRLMSMIKPSLPACGEFIGPGQIASFQGIVKWLIKTPSVVSIIGEFGSKLKQMANERASPHLSGILTFLLEIYAKSGKGQVFDPSAYADIAKNTISIYSPSYSIIGETTPSTFYEVLDEQMIANGLLPRFTMFEYKGKSPYLSKSHKDARPSFALVDGLQALMAQCLSFQQSNAVCEVEAEPDAQDMMDKFDVYSTDMRNSTKSEITKQLWNRAHLKSIRLAALVAVGCNYLKPVITLAQVLWATDLIVREVEGLIAHFDKGEVGLVTNTTVEEYKQTKEFADTITKWFIMGAKHHQAYGKQMTDQMQADFVFAWGAVQIRAFTLPSFKKDRNGSTAALKRVVQHFVDSGDIAEIPKTQAIAKYGTRAKLFCITNLNRFLLAR